MTMTMKKITELSAEELSRFMDLQLEAQMQQTYPHMLSEDAWAAAWAAARAGAQADTIKTPSFRPNRGHAHILSPSKALSPSLRQCYRVMPVIHPDDQVTLYCRSPGELAYAWEIKRASDGRSVRWVEGMQGPELVESILYRGITKDYPVSYEEMFSSPDRADAFRYGALGHGDINRSTLLGCGTKGHGANAAAVSQDPFVISIDKLLSELYADITKSKPLFVRPSDVEGVAREAARPKTKIEEPVALATPSKVKPSFVGILEPAPIAVFGSYGKRWGM